MNRIEDAANKVGEVLPVLEVRTDATIPTACTPAVVSVAAVLAATAFGGFHSDETRVDMPARGAREMSVGALLQRRRTTAN